MGKLKKTNTNLEFRAVIGTVHQCPPSNDPISGNCTLIIPPFPLLITNEIFLEDGASTDIGLNGGRECVWAWRTPAGSLVVVFEDPDSFATSPALKVSKKKRKGGALSVPPVFRDDPTGPNIPEPGPRTIAIGNDTIIIRG